MNIVKDCEGENKVWTYENHTFTAHPVQVGINNGLMTEITGGLSEGTPVVTEAVFGPTEPAAEPSGERSPFMPGPPDRNNKKK